MWPVTTAVRAVAEEIEVHLPFAAKKSDDEIAAALVQRLDWNVSVPDDSVKVKVEKSLRRCRRGEP